ncbi:hypothetical protein H5410_006087 [Solanum commersonii]|uniref:Uncharacterized protein n=1 Tax=Solanum commersonii TaxID=4109 RepID=A0A9J6A8D3_SOLCO|nr:hypothetical protein H5410_006087 [Solanum commersonii]
MYCDHCDMKGHSRVDCNKLKYCTHCHKHGHLKEVCHQLIGYPSNYKGKKIANLVTSDFEIILTFQEMQQLSGGSTNQMPQQYGINSGLGAGSVPYIAPNQYNQSLLNHGLIVKSSGQVQLPNSDSAKVTQSRCSQLQGGDVVKNLNCYTIFYPDFFLLRDLFTGKVKEIGEEDGGLYILKPHQLLDTSQHRSFVASSKDSNEGDDIIPPDDSQIPAQLPLDYHP